VVNALAWLVCLAAWWIAAALVATFNESACRNTTSARVGWALSTIGALAGVVAAAAPLRRRGGRFVRAAGVAAVLAFVVWGYIFLTCG